MNLRGSPSSAVLFTALTACGPVQEFATWPEVPVGSLAFVVVRGPDDVVASHGPYSMNERESVTGSGVLRSFLREGEQLLHISFPPEAIAALVPAFPLNRIDELRVEASAAGCSIRWIGSSRQLSLDAVGATTLVFDGERFVDQSPVPAGLVIHVPIDETTCFAGAPPELMPFGDTEELLPQDALLDGRPLRRRENLLGFAARTAADRLLAASHIGLFVFERGQAWRDDPAHLWMTSRHASRPNPGAWAVRGLDVDPTRSTSETTRIVVALSWLEPSSAPASVTLLAIAHSSSGFREPRIIFEEDDEGLRAVFIQADGRFVAVGDDGLFVTGTVAGEPVERRVDATVGRASLRGLAEGPDGNEPLVLLDGRRTLFFGDGASSEPFRIEPGDPNPRN